MKVLYIGHYKENSGWSRAAIDLILSMDTVGIDVTCRNIKLTSNQFNLPQRILELENKSIQNIDYCIQHVLPHHLVGTNKFKQNIACYIGESTTLKYNNWITNLSIFDQVWIPNHDLINNLKHDGLTENTLKYVPYPSDLSKYVSTDKRIDFKHKNATFKFYYIADLNDRKNIESVIRCFHSEFHKYEQVSLVLKVKKFGVNPQDLNKHVRDICTNVKKTLRIYPKIEDYHDEVVIPDDIGEDGINILHQSCDCLINTTHGEGWSIPAFDAMCFGKTPICGNEGGPKEFIKHKDSGTLVDGVYGICEHSDPAFSNIFTGRESWFVPDEQQIKSAMRYYYENRDQIDRNKGLQDAQEFSYINVGNKIKEILNV